MSHFAGKRRKPATLAAIGLAGLAAFAASPASAQVRDGNNITVFPNADFIAAFGYLPGDELTIEVIRGGTTIGTTTGPAVEIGETPAPESGGLEANHGPEGPVQPGDCWEGFTPDILPGDVIRVTSPDGVDETVVDNIRITKFPHSVGTNVVLEGVGVSADGTPIPPADFDSGEVRAIDPRVRATPSTIVRIPGTTDRWRATYSRPYNAFQEDPGLTDDTRQTQILNGDHAMGYGHVAPLPLVTQLAETGAGGPALGCEASAKDPNSIMTTDDAAVTASSNDLVVSGQTQNGVGSVAVRIVDSNGNDLTLPSPNAPGAWSVGVPRSALASLAEGELAVTGLFDGDPIGTTLHLMKDTLAPGAPASSLPAGSYEGSRSVTLSSPTDPTAAVHYTTNGSVPTAASQRATGPILVTASQTIRAVAIDEVGNAGNVASFPYVITAPAQGGGGGAGAAAPAAAAPAPVADAPRPLFLRSLVTSPRIRRSKAARNGIRLVMRIDDATSVVRIKIYRRTAGGRRLLSDGYKSPQTSGLYRVRQNHRSLRRSLKVGRYEVEVTPGRSRSDLGTTSRYNFRVVR